MGGSVVTALLITASCTADL